MSLVIMVHTNDILKEYFLPAINNADYSIILSKYLFHWEENLEIKLEIIQNQWRFIRSNRYQIISSYNESYFEEKLKNGDRLTLITPAYQKVSLVVVESEQSFQVFRKFDISSMTEISIGSSAGNHIQYDMLNYISRLHALIQHNEAGWVLYDMGRNGVYVDSKRINQSKILSFGDCISMFGLKIVFLNNMLAICQAYGLNDVVISGLPECYLSVKENLISETYSLKRIFKRSPRNLETLYSDDIEIDAPPTIKKNVSKPLFMTIGPAFTMAIPMMMGSAMSLIAAQSRGGGSIYMFTGLVTALASAGVGVFWALSNIKYEKQAEYEEREHRYNEYGKYLIDIAGFLREKYEYNFRVLNEMYISAEECCAYDEHTSKLWNRNFNHQDFLFVRLGIGDIPFQAEIKVPTKKFMMDTDDLSRKPEELKENYKTLYQVPICIDLMQKRLIGLVGGAGKSGALDILRCMVAQIAVNNCYTDVKMAFFYDAKSEEEKQNWEFAKWLPHVWSEDKRTRYIADNKKDAGDICYEITKILRTREEASTSYQKEEAVRPYFVIFLANPELLEGELLAKYVLNPSPEYGIASILLVERYEDLPNSCEDIIQNDGESSLVYNTVESSQLAKRVQFDYVTSNSLEKLTRKLAGIEVNETEVNSEIPNSLDFFEMFGVTSLKELDVNTRWTKNRTYDSMKAIIGKKGGGADCYLDIHEKYHGPHGLIAGTTGSGKSETLQTYILSLAVNFSPYDVGFFIIDFKGGGMANLFSNLPHLIGQISNLSGNQVRRAMISIKSENMRRQRIFTENGVNNINLYTRLYKNGEATVPIPHLFIIIDEFAELKREEPEFMKELISVAQVGRSLGVHLILATQKPSGTVDDNIWSNSKFRLCLRVQDRQDSSDMLHKPDAAYITQAGRGYLQVGNDEIYELFQSGYSGATYEEDAIGNRSSIATMLTITGKTAVMGNKTKKKKTDKKRYEWIYTLVKLIDRILDELNCNVFDAVYNPSIFDELLKRYFSELQALGYDYEENKYNIKCFQDFLNLWPLESVKKQYTEEMLVNYVIREAEVQRVKLPELKDKTQLDAVVEYLKSVANENGYIQNLTLWLPILPKSLPLMNLPEYQQQCFNGMNWNNIDNHWTFETMIGLYDDPENQAQNPLTINFAENGHHAVCGTVSTGKSTFLQTVVYSMIQKYTPEQLNIYLLDFSSHMLSAFEEGPHTGGVVYDTEPEKINRFFNMLEKIMDERKQLFRGGNYRQYVQVNGIVLPAILIVIDNFAGFKEKTKNAYENSLIRISREGVGYGIYMILSAAGFGSSEIQSRIGDNIRTVIALDMGDKFKFAEVLRTTRVEVLPESDVKGRGLAYVGDRILEFQTAVAIEAEDDYSRSKKIEEECRKMNTVWKGACAKRIPEIPENPILSDYVSQIEYKKLIQNNDFLPIGYYMTDASFFGVDLRRTYCYTISGKSRTGKTNILKNILYAANMTNGEICIIENTGNELKGLADNLHARYISSDKEIFDYFKQTISEFKARNVQKRNYLSEGVEEEALFDKMQNYKHIYIFVADIVEFVQSIYRKQEDGTSMNGYIENITEKGSYHNFYFFGCLNPDQITKTVGLKVYSNWIGYKTGIHVGGHVSSVQRIYGFSNIPFVEQDKGMKKGLALTPSLEDSSIAETVVIPLAKGV